MAKVVIHLFHGDEDSLAAGSHVAERVRQVAGDQGVDLEVYCFGPAQGALSDTTGDTKRREYNTQIDDLVDRRCSGGCLLERRPCRRHRGGSRRQGRQASVR